MYDFESSKWSCQIKSLHTVANVLKFLELSYEFATGSKNILKVALVK